MTTTLKILTALLALTMLLAACGGDSEEDSTSSEASTTSTEAPEETTAVEVAEPVATTRSVSESCTDVETFDVEPVGTHFDRDFSAADYDTNPPTSGDHNPMPIPTAQFYDEPPPLGKTVHALEHGAVIGWTNGLSPEGTKTVERAFNGKFSEGYFQLATVENPDLEVPFALSSWDSLQTCEAVDADAIAAFITEHYAPSTTDEALLACSGRAGRLPACRDLAD